ncbi:MAG: hypothetical protein ALECFALPRED_008042 [Alectoria fallacina]|uniref:Uncharacterized protein n=1 Tax=Alectoria fallacina TaxID=1903189 RepID=A0A8H3J1X9_9LECA|nr:MAG: hypothetical protein ALECFALPRED_008042 [Alectoria fallacina]
MVRMWKQKYKRAANTDTQIADPTTERQDLGPSQLASGELSIKKLIPVGDLFEEDVDMTKYDTEGTADEHVAFVTMVDIKKEKLYSFNEQCLHRRLTADICLPNYRPHHVDSSFASPTRNWDLLAVGATRGLGGFREDLDVLGYLTSINDDYDIVLAHMAEKI